MLLLLTACHPPPEPVTDWAEATLVPDPWLGVAGGHAVGQRGRVVETAGWSVLAETGPALRSVTADGEVLWALSDDGVAAWDGAWTTLSFPEGWSAADDLVAADGHVTLLRSYTDCDDCKGAIVHNALATWDGAAWTVTEPALAEVYLRHLAVLTDGTLVAAGIGGVGWWDGAAWTIEELPGLYAYALAADGDRVLVAGESGLVVTGTRAALTMTTLADTSLLGAAWIDGVPWVVGDAAWSGPDWTATPLPAGTWTALGPSPAGVAILGDDLGPVALDGDAAGLAEAWRETAIPTSAVWVDAEGTAWSAGDGAVGRWDTTLTAWTIPGGLRAIDGASPSDVVAVGDEGFAEWDGAGWTFTPGPPDHLWWDVAVAPDGSAFAVGTWMEAEEGTPAFAVRTDAGWEVSYDAAARGGLVAVVAFAADDVYALTWRGEALLRWDGAAWMSLAEALPGEPALLWGRRGDDLYLGGDGLSRWDGASLAAVEGAPVGVLGLTGDADHVLVAGTDGWGDTYAPFVTELRADTWQEQLRGDDACAVGVGGGVDVATAGWRGWRRGP